MGVNGMGVGCIKVVVYEDANGGSSGSAGVSVDVGVSDGVSSCVGVSIDGCKWYT